MGAETVPVGLDWVRLARVMELRFIV